MDAILKNRVIGEKDAVMFDIMLNNWGIKL